MKAMKTILLSLWMAGLCLGMVGCGGGDDDSPATTTVVTTNATTGAVQTNAVAVEDVVADAVAEPATEADEAFGAPVAATTVTGRWIGFCVDGTEKLGLSLDLAQDGEAVTGTYAFWPDPTGSPILSGSLSGTTFLLAVKRNDILFSLEGQVDFAAATISGTWADKAGNSGTFSVRAW